MLPSSSPLCPSGLPRNLEFIKNWVSQAVCQYAAVISPGLLERERGKSLSHTATSSLLSCSAEQ